ncbi:PHP domain-containing protein [Desulfoscipio geothermicus]|uniref:Polymerase/histidinol phosphatase N-terminal domain-containing protein n=1 Tax=Desulfoscipio geothermicus DSM 3669 TaxID=1121426 RepID=A0A1I6E8U3_9FIRM|nr:PHP domain-containing protein [Desulfoscipio geothermicus]SFR14163.1 hypothetical protein SAMN05660706_13019 [Desulfoscipio geothermicus DSM 3669]
MEKYADLHIHSTASDGIFTPSDIVKLAKQKGFSCIALADHDTVGGVKEALKTGSYGGLKVIPAVEMSTLYDGGEVHILGYYVNIDDGQFLQCLSRIAQARIERAQGMVKKLQNLGIEITWEDVLREGSDMNSIGRPHIARVLLKKGHISAISEAFTSDYIGRNGKAYVERYEITPAEAIKIITNAGGIPVLAHPGFFRKTSRLKRNDIEYFVAEGLRGIEVYHTKHTSNDTNFYHNIACEMKLLITGGSDCHGDKNEEILLGKIKLPYEYVNNLRQAASIS